MPDLNAAVFEQTNDVEHDHVCVPQASGEIDVQHDFFSDRGGILLNLRRHFRHAGQIACDRAVLVVIENCFLRHFLLDVRNEFAESRLEIFRMRHRLAVLIQIRQIRRTCLNVLRADGIRCEDEDARNALRLARELPRPYRLPNAPLRRSKTTE